MELIVKYDNRKLYSKTVNSYVNLKYILDLVKLNKPNSFKIVKYKKGVPLDNMTEITSNVLKEAITKMNIPQSKLINFIKEN
jgi:polyhydroxyalkanoate synthesis regulator protein